MYCQSEAENIGFLISRVQFNEIDTWKQAATVLSHQYNEYLAF
jgi:hypothetical protein